MNPTYHVYVSDRGNVFMTEIAAVIAAAISDCGYETVFPGVGLPTAGRGRVNLVVAPHEFFPLQRHHTEPELLRSAEASVSICVEQPGTVWFELGAHYASVGPATLDISPYATEQLRQRGLEARHLQLGYHPSWDRWGGDPAQPRSTDLVFLGSMTPRRDEILTSAAPLLWDCRADIRLFEFARPMAEPRANFVGSDDKWELLASSRVMLNIHRNDVPYFEWVRALEAVINGCLVVTETSTDYGPLVPGEHLVAVPPELLGAYTLSLLGDEPLRTEMTTAAYDLVRTKLELKAALEPICAHLDHVAVPHLRPRREPLPFVRPEAPPPPPRHQVLEDALASELRARARVKELLDSETELVQRIESLQARIAYGRADHSDIETTAAWDAIVPEVSVVITSYNYEHFVTDAMESVMTSTGIAAELIVVDDHSQDGSVEAVRGAMEQAEWYPIRLVMRSANGGVASARHTGISEARTDRVFMLDADNRIYPTTLHKLSTALDRSPDAAFSYGIIAKSGQVGLLSHLPWDVARLCQANYIDAMAMLRRSIVESVGGYDPYCSLRGWEDYELWLRLAAAGCTAAFVPEIVGSYRVHSTSRQQTVNLDTPALALEFRERYPFLPWGDG